MTQPCQHLDNSLFISVLFFEGSAFSKAELMLLWGVWFFFFFGQCRPFLWALNIQLGETWLIVMKILNCKESEAVE